MAALISLPLLIIILQSFLYQPLFSGFVGDELMRQVLSNTSKHLRPVRDHKTSTIVYLRLSLYQILGADSVQGKIHLHFWAEMLWMNEFVRWKPQDHGNVARIDMKVKEMWMPDIIFFTQLSGEHFNEEFPSPPALLSNGITMVLKPFKAELVCVMDAWYFPYDYQSCTFDVGSWAHLASEIDIRPKEDGAADMRFFQTSSVFDVISFGGEYVTYTDPTLETNDTQFSCLTYSLSFKRKPTYFMLNVILPSILINFLCIFNFIIPCETGEKVGYGITVFLAQSVNLMVVSEMMPQGGNSVLGCFLVASILLIALSLFMQILTMSIFFANSKSRAPKWFRYFCDTVRIFVGPFYRLNHEQIALANRNVQIGDPTPLNGTLFSSSLGPPGGPSIFMKQNGAPGSKYGTRIAENDDEEDEEIDTLSGFHDYQMSDRRSSSLTPDASTVKFSRRMSISIPKPRTSFSQAPPSGNSARLPKTSSATVLSDQNHFSSLEPNNKELNEGEIMEEWKVLANVLNRLNGVLFSFLLMTVLLVYAYFHAP